MHNDCLLQVKEQLARLMEKKKKIEESGGTFVPLKIPKGERFCSYSNMVVCIPIINRCQRLRPKGDDDARKGPWDCMCSCHSLLHSFLPI